MRSDGGVQRLRSALNLVYRTNASIPSPTAIETLVPGGKSFSDAAVCVGYFNIPSSRNYVATEELQLPESHGLILQHLAILSRDETAISGSVAGRTSPEPEACGVQVWVSDAAFPRSRLIPLTGVLSPGGGLIFVADAPEMIVDRIVLQGQFEHLTVCLYGRPFDVQTDPRVLMSRRLMSSGVRRRIARVSVSPSFVDICPIDAAKFDSNDHSSSKFSLSADTPAVHQSRSVPTCLCLKEPSQDFADLVDSLCHNNETTTITTNQPENPSTTTNSSSSNVLQIPDLSIFQELACNLIPELRLFDFALPNCDTGILTHKKWRNILSLILWPLQYSSTGTYSAFLTLIISHLSSSDESTDNQEKKVTGVITEDGSAILSEAEVPIFNPASGTSDQIVAALQLLAAVVKESKEVIKLLIKIDAVRVIAKLSGLEITIPAKTSTISAAYPEIAEINNPCYRVQIAAMHVLAAISCHRVGIMAMVHLPQQSDSAESLISVYEALVIAMTKKRDFARMRGRNLFLEIASNVKLLSLINRCLATANNFQTKTEDEIDEEDKEAIGPLIESVSALSIASQWDLERQQEYEEIGEGFSSTIHSRLSRLSQIGSNRGERNDGFGPDNHPKSAEVTKESFCERFSRIVDSAPLIPLLLKCRSKLSKSKHLTRNSKKKSVPPKESECPTETQSSSNTSYLTAVQNQKNSLKFSSNPTLRAETEINGLLTWYLMSTVGALSFLSSGFTCKCPGCFSADCSTGSSSDKQHHSDSLVEILPLAVKEFLSRILKSQNLIMRLIYCQSDDDTSDSNVAAQDSKKRTRDVEESNDSDEAQVYVSFKVLQELSEFVSEPDNAGILLIAFKNDIPTLASCLARIFKAFAITQLTELDASNTIVESLEIFNGHACIIAAIKFTCNIVLSLTKVMYSESFVTHFAASVGDIVTQMGQISRECLQSCNTISDMAFNSSRHNATGWGITDLSVDAYESFDIADDNNDARTSGALQTLVPSSLFTALHQVFNRDHVFAMQVTEIAAICQIIKETAAASREAHDRIQTSETLFDPSVSLATASAEIISPSKMKAVKFLISLLQTIGASISPNIVVPTSESVEIANSGGLVQPAVQTQGTASSIAPRLGGFSGAMGVPSLEIRWPESKVSPEGGGNDANTGGGGPQSIPPDWISQSLIVLRLLIREATSAYQDRSAKNLMHCSILGVDQFAEAIRSDCLDDPIFAIQEGQATLRVALTQMLIGLAAALSPSSRLCDIGLLEGTRAAVWFESIKDAAIVLEAALQLLYVLLDNILPVAPYPISPLLTTKLASQRALPSVSRFASTTGTSWLPGELTDSSLRDALIIVTAQLGSVWCHLGRLRHPSVNAFKTLERVCSSLDIACAAMRLWVWRCPGCAPAIISAIIRHARVEPSRFIVVPLLITAIGGLSLVLPANETVVKIGDSQPPIMALELMGAEGRNLEAVVTRLKQMYVLKRQMDSARTGIGAGPALVPATAAVGSRLPPSMTTLNLSARCHLPTLCEDALYGSGMPHYLRFQIPLVPPSMARHPGGGPAPPPGPQQPGNCGPAGHEWVRRRLGRLTVGHEADLLSQSIFKADKTSTTTQQLPKLAALASAAASAASIDVPEWAGWDRTRDLLFESLEEEAIETAIESDRMSAVPLGLSPAVIATLTESRAQAKEVTRALLQETNLEEGKKHLLRLEKIAREFKYLKVEEIGEIISVLALSTFSSNAYLHAATAHALAYLSLSEGPPVLDILLLTARSAVENLSSFLARELLLNRRHGLSQLFLISKLMIFIDNTFNTYPCPTLECAMCSIQLAAEGFKALQDVPVIDQSCPTYPVLMGLFDCILPAATRLLRSGLHIFGQFLTLSSQPISQQIAAGLTNLQPTSESAPSQWIGGASKGASKCRNAMIYGQFALSLEKRTPGTTAVEGADLIAAIRSCCQGLCAVINQLPVAWEVPRRSAAGLDTRHMEDPALNWTGLATSTIEDILETFEVLTSSRLLCAVSLFDIPASFIESYCETIQKMSASGVPATDSQLVVSGTPDPTIKLDSFVVTLSDAVTHYATRILSESPALSEERELEKEEDCEVSKRLSTLLSIIGSFISIGHSLFTKCNLNSAPLLLPFITSDPINSETFGGQPQTSEADEKDDAAEIYGGLDDILKTSTIANSKIDKKKESSSPMTVSLRNSFMQGILDGMQLLKKTLQTNETMSRKLKELEAVVDSRINEIIELRKIVKDMLTSNPPTLILRAPQLLEDIFMSSQEPPGKIFLDRSTTSPPGYSKGIPLFFGKSCTGVSNPCLVPSINQIANDMMSDPLWNNCALLDTVICQDQETRGVVDSFECLKDILRSIVTGEIIPANTSLMTYFSDSRHFSLAPPSVAWHQPIVTIPPVTATMPRACVPTPVAGVESASSFVAPDPFRARKGGPSSRAPSKHVDEFEAEQQQAAGKIDDSDAHSVEASLAAIPQWAEFVAGGAEKGLNIMEILKTPHLLQDPQIESKFRSLVDLHPSIQALFQMMELQI